MWSAGLQYLLDQLFDEFAPRTSWQKHEVAPLILSG